MPQTFIDALKYTLFSFWGQTGPSEEFLAKMGKTQRCIKPKSGDIQQCRHPKMGALWEPSGQSRREEDRFACNFHNLSIISILHLPLTDSKNKIPR